MYSAAAETLKLFDFQWSEFLQKSPTATMNSKNELQAQINIWSLNWVALRQVQMDISTMLQK
jgi:hypothetical protein